LYIYIIVALCLLYYVYFIYHIYTHTHIVLIFVMQIKLDSFHEGDPNPNLQEVNWRSFISSRDQYPIYIIPNTNILIHLIFCLHVHFHISTSKFIYHLLYSHIQCQHNYHLHYLCCIYVMFKYYHNCYICFIIITILAINARSANQ
jgi:hypothetical protein